MNNSSLTIRVICLVAVLLTVFSQSDAKWWCFTDQDCKWSEWSSWMACSHECGPDGGVTDRYRHHAQSQKCSGSDCYGPSHQTKECNRCFQGDFADDNCDCFTNYYGVCCENFVRYYCLLMQMLNNNYLK